MAINVNDLDDMAIDFDTQLEYFKKKAIDIAVNGSDSERENFFSFMSFSLDFLALQYSMNPSNDNKRAYVVACEQFSAFRDNLSFENRLLYFPVDDSDNDGDENGSDN